MDQYFKTEKQLLEGIIERKGDCVAASWCMMCPFNEACVLNAISKARLLPKEERVKRAVDKLFIEALEEELDDQETNDS